MGDVIAKHEATRWIFPTKTTECDSQHTRIASPVAEDTRRLIWGDWNKGEYGILVRALDRHDDPSRMKERHMNSSMFHKFQGSLLPASYLHASMRAPNAIYNYDVNFTTVAGLLVGSRFSRNWSMNHHSSGEDVVETRACYPLDAGSNKRRKMLTTKNGGGCHPGGPRQHGICINSTCLATYSDDCACNHKDVPGHAVGAFFADWLQTTANNIGGDKKIGFPSRYSCWYDSDHFSELVGASNSLWKERKRWTHRHDSQYPGWNECAVTMNMKNDATNDAIVVQLPIQLKQDSSLCDYGTQIQADVLKELHLMHEFGFRDIPVVFLEQSRGMMNKVECDQLWNGTRCSDGYRKNIFAQTFNFSDGSRLAVPGGCKDVYFFPPNKTNRGMCQVHSAMCKKYNETSPYYKGVDQL